MPIWQCEGSTRRFDSVPYSVCLARRTNARRNVTVYYHVLISERRRGWERGTRPGTHGGEGGWGLFHANVCGRVSCCGHK